MKPFIRFKPVKNCFVVLVLLLGASLTPAQQFYGNAFEYELKSNDSLYLDLVLFVDCTADTSFTPGDIVLSTSNKTDSFSPAFRYAEDVTPLENGVKSRCEDPSSTIQEGIQKQVYRIGVDLDNAFPNACKIDISWGSSKVLPYDSGVSEDAYMKGWLNYCQFKKGQSTDYQYSPPFLTGKATYYDPWVEDPDNDSFRVNFRKLQNQKGLSSYYDRPLRRSNCTMFPCCRNIIDPCGPFACKPYQKYKYPWFNEFSSKSAPGAFFLGYDFCIEKTFYLENRIKEYRNGQQIAQMPYEMVLAVTEMRPQNYLPSLKKEGPYEICVGDTLNLDLKYETETQQDSIYLTAWQFFDSSATMALQSNQPVKGQFQWVPEPGDYRKEAYQLKVRAVNEVIYKRAKTQTIPIKVKKDTGVHVHQMEQSRVCDSLYVKADSITGPGPYQYNWSINGSSVNGDSSLHYKFDTNGTYRLKLTVHSRPACESFQYFDTIRVNNLVKAKIQAPDTVCPGANPTISVNASSGADSFFYTWNTGLSGDTIRPVIKDDSVLAVKVVNQDGCAARDTFLVNTYPHQPITCQPAEKTYCWNGPVDTLGYCDKPVYWKGPGIEQDSLFDPAEAYTGKTDTFPLVATHQDTNGCFYHDTLRAIVQKQPVVNLSPDTICQDGSVINLPDSAANGILGWSGVGVRDSIFDPALVTSGTHYAQFTHTHATGCRFRDSLAIEVFEKPVIDTQLAFCSNRDRVALPGYPGSQNWQGPGVNANTLHVETLQPGSYHLQFDYHDSTTTCQFTDSLPVKIKDTPHVHVQDSLEICNRDTLIGLNPNPSGGQWNVQGLQQDSVNPTHIGIGQHQLIYTYTDSAGCTNADTLEMRVYALPDMAFDVQPQSGQAPFDVSFTYTGSDPLAAYKWFIGPEADTLSGAQQNYTFTDTGQHVVILKGISQAGCTGTLSKMVQVNGHSDGIYQKAEELGVRLYPNPGKAEVMVEAKSRIRKIHIRDLQGSTVQHIEHVDQKTYEMQVGTFGAGYYLVEVTFQNGQKGMLPMALE